jgi:hypothetical protein
MPLCALSVAVARLLALVIDLADLVTLDLVNLGAWWRSARPGPRDTAADQ